MAKRTPGRGGITPLGAEMTEQHDGGPAFPARPTEHLTGGISITAHHGMSLRDYFAAKAMQGLVASNDEGAGDRLSDIPGYAYAIADAMLAARSDK